MKINYITLCFSINLIAAAAPLPNIFDVLEQKQTNNTFETLKNILQTDKTAPYSKNSQGQTPLMVAIIKQNKQLASMIKQKTDEYAINIQDDHGNTALHYNYMYNMPIGLFLIKARARIDIANHKKETPIHLAATDTQQFGDILAALRDKNLNLNLQDLDGNTPLHIAAKYKQENNIISLIGYKASTTIQNNYGFTPLHIAIISKFIPYILINDKVSYNIQDNAGNTPLHLLILFHNQKSFQLQIAVEKLSKNMDLTLPNEYGETPKQLAKKFNKAYLFNKNKG